MVRLVVSPSGVATSKDNVDEVSGARVSLENQRRNRSPPVQGPAQTLEPPLRTIRAYWEAVGAHCGPLRRGGVLECGGGSPIEGSPIYCMSAGSKY